MIRDAQESLIWAQHVVILYPLWLGSMPSLLKAFLEQVMRPGFAFGEGRQRGLPKKLLAGRSARVIITMGMPGPFYRIFYRAHSLKSLERNILRFVGFAPVRSLIIGGVENLKPRTVTSASRSGSRAWPEGPLNESIDHRHYAGRCSRRCRRVNWNRSWTTAATSCSSVSVPAATASPGTAMARWRRHSRS